MSKGKGKQKTKKKLKKILDKTKIICYNKYVRVKKDNKYEVEKRQKQTQWTTETISTRLLFENLIE